MTKKVYKIKGLSCPSCAALLECDLEDIGIKARCSYPKSCVEVEGAHNTKKVIEMVKKSGYQIAE